MNGVIKYIFVVVFAWDLQLTALSAPLPFLETFEVADGVMLGTIDGQNGWVLESGTGEVQSDVWLAGSGNQGRSCRTRFIERRIRRMAPRPGAL